MSKRDGGALDPEIAAISTVYQSLEPLEADSQRRVLDFVAAKLGLERVDSKASNRGHADEEVDRSRTPLHDEGDSSSGEDGLDGISPVAAKWMRRNGLTADALSKVFSLGVDDIDLVAKTVPGKSKKERMHSVLLLKGVAAYLSAGVARVAHDQVKEACLHYDAFNTTNFAAYLRTFAAEVSGTKEAGYTLTARGLTVATERLKDMTAVGGG